ncbi:hypothetical protein L0666_09680 [Octadecabacter sp. CECT 8868]|uniref:hypothetical protein n=1 Tax=Octadecabacter algicola TaxID=2909342 RepID=UPI001F27AD86|nr:hypothetical protein [Octadecabacter algicola]MCF2905259.1 hypothetical protein [Octadecabacter algicola]
MKNMSNTSMPTGPVHFRGEGNADAACTTQKQAFVADNPVVNERLNRFLALMDAELPQPKG